MCGFLLLSRLERGSAGFPSDLRKKNGHAREEVGMTVFELSAPARISGGEEAGRFLTIRAAREEVGAFGSR